MQISPRLHAQYPEEMTIVLQHQFWDLGVTDVISAPFPVGDDAADSLRRTYDGIAEVAAMVGPA